MGHCYTKHVECPDHIECGDCRIKPNNERVTCCECGKNVLKINAKKHPYNNDYDYCKPCFNFWFGK